MFRSDQDAPISNKLDCFRVLSKNGVLEEYIKDKIPVEAILRAVKKGSLSLQGIVLTITTVYMSNVCPAGKS